MLLELRQLSESLAAAGITVEQQDGHLVGYPKGKQLFRVALDAEGQVRSLTPLADEVARRLVKYELDTGAGRGVSTPGFNTPPLFAVPDVSDVAGRLKTIGKQLKRPPKDESHDGIMAAVDVVMAGCKSGWDTGAKKIAKCLTSVVDVVAAHLDSATGDDRVAAVPLRELLRRIKLLTPEGLHTQLVAAARAAILAGGAAAEPVFQFTFTKDAALLFELDEWKGLPANHETVWRAVNRLLLARKKDGSTACAGDTIRDAFGAPFSPTREVMPELNLPRLGNVKLRSNSSLKPCQSRYGMTDGDGCPVGADVRAALASSLRWLIAEEREGQTFRDISNACGFDLPALLLAYPDPLPTTHAPALAAVLAKANQTGPLSSDVRFIAAAEVLLKQLDDLKVQKHNANITIFVLAKRDTARTKLLLHRQFSADRISDAIREWTLAATNLPPVFVRQPGEDKKPGWRRCDDTPYPSDVARLLNTTWTWDRDELRPKKVGMFDYGSALALLLDLDRTEVAAEGLRLTVGQWVDLLLAMGQASTLGQVCTFSLNEQRQLPTIIGLLLAKLGHPKEEYMAAMPYWIGRLLAVADKFHRNYCDVERDRKYPPQLIGNATMPTCLENPQAGLARLSERLPLYQQVAGVQLGTEAAEIVSNIDPENLPKRATDEQKAQMLLGYLARPDLLKTETTTITEAQS